MPKEIITTEEVKLTPAQIRAGMIVAKISAGLRKDQAERVVDAQLAHDKWLRTEEAKRTLAPSATSPVGAFVVSDAADSVNRAEDAATRSHEAALRAEAAAERIEAAAARIEAGAKTDAAKVDAAKTDTKKTANS